MLKEELKKLDWEERDHEVKVTKEYYGVEK